MVGKNRALVKCCNGKYFGNWSKSLLTAEKGSPRLLKCKSCNRWVWNFNMRRHYNRHPQSKMTNEEKTALDEISSETAALHLSTEKSSKTYGKHKRSRSKPKVKGSSSETPKNTTTPELLKTACWALKRKFQFLF